MSATRDKSKLWDKPSLSYPGRASSSELLSSEDYEDPEIQPSRNDLQDVEEKSFFSSEPQEPDRNDIKDFLGKIERLGIGDLGTPLVRSNRSQRLQDQQIIVVEEENEMASNCNNESVILEHIEFNNVEQQRDNTPDWDQEEQSGREGEHQYVINYIGIRQPPWIAPDHENASYSSPCDFQNSDIRPIRNSKNTCADRQEVYELENQIKEGNKSCIAKPMGGNDSSQMSIRAGVQTTGSEKNQNFRQILNKWNEEIYPRLEEEYMEDRFGPRRISAEYQMEKDSKLCLSKYNLGSQCHKSQTEKEAFLPEYSSSKVQPISSKQHNKAQANLIKRTSHKCEASVQTNLTGVIIDTLEQQIEETKHKLHRSQQENNRLKQKCRNDSAELVKFREALQNKQKQYDQLKNSYRQLQIVSEQDRKWGEQSRKLENQNKELERMFLQQSEILKKFEEKTELLQKKMLNSYNREDSPRSPTFPNDKKAKKSSQNEHEQCNKLIEELQEYIFDIQQKIAGFDIEVGNQVRAIAEQIEQEARRRTSEEHRVVVNNLRDQIVRLNETLKLHEEEKMENLQRIMQKEKEIKARETEVNRMYEQLVAEWKEIEKQKEKSKWKSSIPANSPPTAAKMAISPISRAMQQIPAESRPRMTHVNSPHNETYYFSNRQLGSPRKRETLSNTGVHSPEGNTSFQNLYPNSSSFRNERKIETKVAQLGTSQIQRHHHLINEQNKWGKRQLPKMPEARQNNELVAINNKIQRLRKEINRQLEAIH